LQSSFEENDVGGVEEFGFEVKRVVDRGHGYSG
jgi:hypothetical protein